MLPFIELNGVGPELPIVASVPHSGTFVPDWLVPKLDPEQLEALPNTDWFLAQLYDFLPKLGVRMIVATHSRYVGDLNRPEKLAFGDFWKAMVAEKTASGRPVYRTPPTSAELERMRDEHHRPYHRRLAALLAEVQSRDRAPLYLLSRLHAHRRTRATRCRSGTNRQRTRALGARILEGSPSLVTRRPGRLRERAPLDKPPSASRLGITPWATFLAQSDPSCHKVAMVRTGMSVLLVDDSKAMRQLVHRTLLDTELPGVHVEEAENGSDALAKLANGEPDLILSDWSMPEMNGVELLRELRARGSAVKFGFVVSEPASQLMRDKAFEAGAQFVLECPFSVERFRDLLCG